MEKEQLSQELKGIKENLDASVEKVKTDLEKSINELKAAQEKSNVKEIVAEATKNINDSLKVIQSWKEEKDKIDPLNQEAINKMLTELKQIGRNTSPKEGKTFQEAFSEAVEKNYDDIQNVSGGQRHMVRLEKGLVLSDSVKSIYGPQKEKSVGTISTSASLTGDSVLTYSPRQAFLPQQKINIRDLMRTVTSETGTYCHYKETAGEGSIGQQTEGNAKSQIDFDLTEVKTVNKYYAGFVRVTKQMLRSIPFLQGTLPSLLMREFFHYENNKMKSIIAAAANNASPSSETDDVKQIIDYIAYQRDLNYGVDFAVVNHTQKAALDKLTYTTGYYATAGGVVSGTGGTTQISGVPIIAASWMNSSKVLLVDSDYLERIEVEGLRVQFFEEDADNVTKNLVTIRIECFEEVNPMLGSAFLYSNL